MGFRRPVSNDGERIYRSAEIGKISILGTRLSGSCWTSCSGHEWDVLWMRIWKRRKTVGGMCRAPLSVDVFGIFVSCVGRLSTFIPPLRWMPTQKGAGHIYFYLSAKAHSPDVHLPICSHGPGLERGWSCTAESPCIQKRCHVACNRSQSTSYLRNCSAELMAKRPAPATFLCHKDIPYVSPISSP